MASPRSFMALAAVAIAVTACSGSADETGPVITRALLPAADSADPIASTTTTQAPLSPAASDQLARTEIRSVLAAAAEIYAETGSYEAEPAAIAALSDEVDVVSLEQAALYDAVAYAAFDERLTLHRQSASGRWFCLDVTDHGADHGSGDTFEQALEDCTDGVRASGWGDVFSPTGPDEAAITAVLTATSEALATGDTPRIHELFEPQPTCTAMQLEAILPIGLPLTASEVFALEDVSVSGETATASVMLGSLSDPIWPLVRRGNDWLNGADPCELLGPLAADRTSAAARQTLDRGLFAVRSLYVAQSSFSFPPSALADFDADLIVVAPAEVGFGTIAYRGSQTEGVVITTGGPGVFYCAVESSFAVTVHGEGSSVDQVDTANRCRTHPTP
ncbi:MAG: hypothetical protein HKN80_02620 [Acidimicrobiia bacterium]|nr:hypothetical protein [Acidimicrobiia bacterium]